MFLAIVGIPGIGKTSICERLSSLTGAEFFGEPKRSEWPAFIDEFFEDHAFEVLMWFRVYQFVAIKNCKLASNNGLAITDAYYHKFLSEYIDSPNSEWIISKTDPYFGAFREVINTDQAVLPNADAIVNLIAQESTWREMVRSRQGTRDDTLLDHAFGTQKDITEAARSFSNRCDIPFLLIDQKLNCIDATVNDILRFLDGIPHGT